MNLPSHVVILENSKGDLRPIEEFLVDRGYVIHRTTSVLHVIELVRGSSVIAIVCDEVIQIGSALTLPDWIVSEVGFLPAYFIVSEHLITMDDVLNHKCGKMVRKLFSNFEELSGLSQILQQIDHDYHP